MANLTLKYNPQRIMSTKVSESQWLLTIHLAARCWTASSKVQSLVAWEFHTTQAYSMHGLTMLLYAMSFASAEHPNIVLCKIFKILAALEAVSLQ